MPMKAASKSGRMSFYPPFTLWLTIAARVIKVDSIFTNYRIQSNANNEITMLLTAEALLSALKSASTTAETADSDDVVLKLAKKNDQAILCFEINGTTRLGKSMRVSHDVKIEVMKPTDVASLKEPMCPDPDVSTLYIASIYSNERLFRFIFCCLLYKS